MVAVFRTEHHLEPDPGRVVARPFLPGEVGFGGEPSRVDRIIERIEGLTDEEVAAEIEANRRRSLPRHRDVASVWRGNAEAVSHLAAEPPIDLTGDRYTLLGMVFTQEYAFQSAGLCNPSMVPVGDAAANGDARFVMSTRAIGEGHISSICFRSGSLSHDGTLKLDEGSRWADNGTRTSPLFDREIFRERLHEFGIDNELSHRVLEEAPPRFRLDDLEKALSLLQESEVAAALRFETERAMHWLANSNYDLTFGDIPLAERVLSPTGPAESRGMEDARFVRFTDDDGSVRFYATYSAFDGFEVLPQLIETEDFQSFRIATLAGSCARSKGMALFPRRIGGAYVALARTDNESTFLMHSDHPRRWDEAELVCRPTEPWELVQAGNCGSPIETPEGWLVLMHGVGPMRRYVLSAVLLDLHEPTKVAGRLREPLLEPNEEERLGYVPNVVYSCGGMVHGDVLVIPYGYSDTGIRFATASLSEVLSAMA